MKNLLDIDKSFCLIEEGYEPKYSKHYEGLFTQGNGYIHVRGSYEEGLLEFDQAKEYIRKPANVTLEAHKPEKTKWGTYIPGIVGEHPFLKNEIINLPYIFEMRFLIDSKLLDMDQSKIFDYSRWLDLKRGLLCRSFIYEEEDGTQLEFYFERFINKASKHEAWQKIEVTCLKKEAAIKAIGGINYGVRTNGFEHILNRQLLNDEKSCGLVLETNGGNKVCMKSSFRAKVDERDVKVVERDSDSSRTYEAIEITLKQGQKLEVIKTIAITTDRDLDEKADLIDRASDYLDIAVNKGYEISKQENFKLWEEAWQHSDIKIRGNISLQLAVRASIYHLLRSKPADDYRVAICAKGYAGEAYFGRYFWDTEINMLPFFIHNDPIAARNLERFRYETLAGAKRNALNYGYKGARYPWESSITGDEECPNWQYCDHEIHITADIVYAIAHLVRATDDMDFLINYGAEIMIETARYWVSRVSLGEDGLYHLNGVMGPDEYLPMTRDNTYTNAMVIFSLEETLRTLSTIEQADEKAYENLLSRLYLTKEEMDNFSFMASHIYRGYDANSLVIKQSADFDTYEDIDFDEIWTDRSKCFGSFISQEKNYRSKALKQADLLELMMLFRDDFSTEQLRANYDYYEPICTHDSSLSAAIHGILCCWLGDIKAAVAFLNRVVAIDMDVQKLGASEGIHIANCGGLWQLLIYGFAGVKSAFLSKELIVEPHLPACIEAMEFKLDWHGKCYEIQINQEGYTKREIA